MPKKLIKKTARKSIQKTIYIGSKFRDHASTAIIAAFGFLIAISWKDFIITLVKDTTKTSLLEKYPYIAELYTAIIITILAIIGIALISKWAKKDENKT